MKLKWMILFIAVTAGFLVGCRQEPVKQPPTVTDTRKVAYYTCPMHPSVHEEKPGACPICGMTLTPVYTNAPAAP